MDMSFMQPDEWNKADEKESDRRKHRLQFHV